MSAAAVFLVASIQEGLVKGLMRSRSIALTRQVRATSMASCLLGLSSALPITERISSISLSTSFLASSLSSEFSML